MTLSSQRQPESNERTLALSLIQVVQMWSNPRYDGFLNQTATVGLTEEWFGWFVGNWRVARNIKDGHQADVRKHLDSEFRGALAAEDCANCVDEAAQHIQRQGWTTRGCFPVSLVSKAGFFLRPDRLVPIDRFSLQGLNRLRDDRRAGKLTRGSYSAYLEAFDEEYAHWEGHLKLALYQNWVLEMADRLGCPRNALGSLGMRRKLFDDFLMHIGDYRV